MATKPIRVFWCELSGKFYATKAYRIEGDGDSRVAIVTGQKFDVTQDIAGAIIRNNIEFTKVKGKAPHAD